MAVSELGLRIVVTGERSALAALAQFDRATNKAASGMSGVGRAIGQVGSQITNVGRTIATVGGALTFGLTLPIAGLAREAIGAGIEFEDAFAGIAKTIEGVADVGADGTLVLSDMGEALRDIVRTSATEIPIAATELAKIGEIAGQLGVRGTKNLDIYIDTIAKLGVTTDLTTEKAAFNIARLGNILGIAGEDIGTFAQQTGSALVELGNRTASTESEITTLAMRIAAAGRIAGLTTPEILGFSSAAAQMGIPAERGGTAVSRIFQEMGFAVGQGVEETIATIQTIPEEFQGVADDLVNERNQLIQDITRTELAGALGFGESKPFEAEEQFEGQLSSLRLQLQHVNEQLGIVEAQSGVSTAAIMENSDALGTFAAIADQGTTDASIGVQDFARIFEEDAVRATELFISGLARMQEEGTLTEDMLREIGLNGVRVRDVLNRFGSSANFASGEIDVLRESIGIANEGYDEMNALNVEAEKRFATFKSQLRLAENAFKDLGITIFDLIKDDLRAVVDTVIDIIDRFKNMDEESQKLILTIAAIAAAAGPLLLIVGGLVIAIGSFVAAIGAIISLSPAAIAAIAGIAGIAGVLGNNLVKDFRGMDLSEVGKTIKDKILSAIGNIVPEVSAPEVPEPTQPEGEPAPPAAPVLGPEARLTGAAREAFVRSTAEAETLRIEQARIPDFREMAGTDEEAFRQARAAAAPRFAAQSEEARRTQTGPSGLRATLDDFRQAEAEIDKMTGPITTLSELLSGVGEAFQEAFQDEELREAISELGETLGLVFGSVSEGSEDVNLLQGALSTITGIIRGTVEAFTWIISAVNTFIQILFIVYVTIERTKAQIFTKFDEIGQKIRDFVDDAIGFFTNLDLAGNSIVPDMLEDISSIFTDKFGEVLDTVLDWKDDVIGAFNRLKEKIFGVVDQVTGKLGDIGKGALELLASLTGSPELKLQHVFERFEEYMKDADFTMNLGASVSSAVGNIAGVVPSGGIVNNTRTTNNEVTINGVPSDRTDMLSEELNTQFRILEGIS